MIKVNNLKCKLGDVEILHGVSIHVNKGEFVGIIGPNGSGKSTLIKNICKLHRSTPKAIEINGKYLSDMSNKEMALDMAIVLQEHDAVFDFSVEEVMQMGRYPYKKLLEETNEEDEKIIRESLEEVGMESFIDRSFLSLSGGEKQRVLIARALAQRTDIIVLDEPTNHLDVGSCLNTLDLLKKSNKTVVAALHDLTTAAKYCDRLYVVKDGLVIGEGKPKDIITSDLIEKLYGVKAEIFHHNDHIFVDYCD